MPPPLAHINILDKAVDKRICFLPARGNEVFHNSKKIPTPASILYSYKTFECDIYMFTEGHTENLL